MDLPVSAWVGLVVGIAVISALFLIEWNIERKAPYVTLTPFEVFRDPKDPSKLIGTGQRVDFDPRQGHYMKLAEVLITLAAASLVFIPSHLPGLPRIGFSMVLLGTSVLYALMFMATLTYFYEMFLFNPISFTAWKSSLMFSSGFAALICFALAYGWLSLELAIALKVGMVR